MGNEQTTVRHRDRSLGAAVRGFRVVWLADGGADAVEDKHVASVIPPATDVAAVTRALDERTEAAACPRPCCDRVFDEPVRAFEANIIRQRR
jgi:hypothetical protein